MSRVGKKPIKIPEGIKITYEDNLLSVQGGKGVLARQIPTSVALDIEDGFAHVRAIHQDRKSRALQGLMRSLVDNMFTGADKGFERTLEINGIGYRAELKGNTIILNIGYSRPIAYDLPEGVTVSIEKNNIIKLYGIDKELLGRTAASIRRLRPPEPYKGKGIKYAEEHIQRKAGKTGTK